MLAAAAPSTGYNADPAVFWVVCSLALAPLIGGSENIGVIAFPKELRFRSEFAFQISPKLAGVAVTGPLAFWLRRYLAPCAGILPPKTPGTPIPLPPHPFPPPFSIPRP